MLPGGGLPGGGMLKAGPMGLGGKGGTVDEEAGGLLHPQRHSLGVPGLPCTPVHGSPQRGQACPEMEGLRPPP